MPSRRLSLAAIVLVGTSALSAVVFTPFAAHATAPVAVVENVPDKAKDAINAAKTALRNSAEYAITTAVVSAVDTMTQRLAANAATWLVAGGNGQSPLAYITGWDSWHNNIIMDSVSDTLNQLSVKYAGFGICQPINPQVNLRIKLGIARMYAPKPSCTFNDFWSKGVLGTGRNLSSGQFLQGITANFEMGQSSLSVALNTPIAVVNKATNKYLDKQSERLSGNGFKALTDIITGDVKTPASMVEETIKTDTTQSFADKDKYLATAVMNKTDLFAAVGANALKMFTSTLAQKALDKYLKGGMINGKEVFCATSYGQSFNLCKGIVNGGSNLAGGTTGNVGTALASAFFASIFSPQPTIVDDYSPIAEMSSCPEGTARGTWNCVMDQSFVSALSGRDNGYLSVREALKPENGSLLHGNWQLVPPSDSRSNDRNCYQSAYCYSNLVKLRRMRIIPAGWEMAALVSEGLGGGEPITLQGAVDKFNDSKSPYYHLVDPDWILKVPVTQCRQQVYGQALVAPDSGERSQVCVDAPSCISEDANGKCTGGYGYCTREHNVWQIDANACPAQFASCGDYTDKNGKELSVLSNTVDSSYCTEANSGCKPYAAIQTAAGWTDGTAQVFLNAKAQSCNASDAGCRSLGRVSSSSTANILPNPGLEYATSDGSMAQSWTKDWENAGGASRYVRDGISSYEGLAAYLNADTLSLGGYHNLGGTVDIPIEPNQQYTLSFYARSAGAAAGGQLELKLFDRPFNSATSIVCPAYPSQGPKPTCVQDLSTSSMLPSCSTTNRSPFALCQLAPGGDWGPINPNGEIKTIFPLGAGYDRYTVTFATTADSHYIGLYFTVPQGPYYLDAFQLEKGPTATFFHEGGSDAAGTPVNIKVPPDYLGCTGEPDLDTGKSCGNYARVCRQSEVGCDEFSPTDGGPAITAVATGNDYCSAKCVGYSTFKQEKTVWEGSKFPLYFIPSTGTSCRMSEVGCDEFTNLAKASSGGEAREYYTYLRSCRQPDAPVDGTYFTWEGSDVSGFQLKSYVLRNATGGDVTLMTVPNTNGVYFVQNTDDGTSGSTPVDRGPAYLAGTDPSLCTQAIYRPAAGSSSNPDCREFIDSKGNIFYRLLSATVEATNECQTYRKTVSTQADCQGSGGIWNGGSQACEYFVYSKGSRACRAEASGCRAYTGNQGNNAREVMRSDFENDNADGWGGGAIAGEATTVGGHSYGTRAMTKKLLDGNGSPLLKKGSLYMLTVWAKGGGRLDAKVSYNGNINSMPNLPDNNYFADPAGIRTPSYPLTADWQRFSLGPIAVTWAPTANDLVSVSLDNYSGAAYFDNITLVETQDQFALVKGSWKTPAVCDQTPAGQPLPQAQLGCSGYDDRNGTPVNLKSFDRLCRASSVGCEAMSDNQGTDTQFAQYRNVKCTITQGGAIVSGPCIANGKTLCTVLDKELSCRFDFDGAPNYQLKNYTDASGRAYAFDYSSPDVFAIAPDATRFLVNDGSRSCDASAVGCTALGDSTLSKLATCTAGGAGLRACAVSGRTVCWIAAGQSACSYRIPLAANGNTVYKLIQPADIGDKLCVSEAVACQTWTNQKGETSYFKDPGDAICAYQDKVEINGQEVSGWFKKGTTEPCDPTFAIGGTDYGIRKNGDAEFSPNNFAGACKSEYAGCTEFTDHSDLGATYKNGSREFPQGRPLYYVKDGKIDSAVKDCNNQVSKKQGCLLLDQTDNPNKSANTEATYALSDGQGFKLVAPVDNGKVNDANIVLRVKRDRVCTEWLECNTEQAVTDKTGRDNTRCLSVGSCTKKGADGRCITWGSLNSGFPVLSKIAYASRDVTSSGSDYSGFSIPNKPPAFAFRQSAGPDYTLNVNGAQVEQTCKAYPESDAPFPRSVLNDSSVNAPVNGSRKQGFNNASVCETNINITKDGAVVGTKDCECSYRKAVYGSYFTKFFPTNAETGTKADGTPGEIKSALCSGGPYDGQECVVLATGNRTPSNLSCNNGNQQGTCAPFDKVDSVLGQKGYCLEKDKSLAVNGSDESACITWLPIDTVKGIDTANQFTSAAFIPKIGQERYCAAPAKYCVARDCQGPPKLPALCTELAGTVFTFTDVNTDASVAATCMSGCTGLDGTVDQGGQPDCRAKAVVCRDIVDNYCKKIDGYSACQGMVREDPSCVGFDAASSANSSYCSDLYGQCQLYIPKAQALCANLRKNKCMDTNPAYDGGGTQYVYGGDWRCTSDITLPSGQVVTAGFGGDPSVYYVDNPSANIDSFCGYKFGTPLDQYFKKGTLQACATTGTQFCGNGESCPAGQDCAAMNNLTVHQNEYTLEESGEAYGNWRIVTAADGTQTKVFNTKMDYSTVPASGSRSAFGSANAINFPTISSSSLRFSVDKVSGDWINVYNQALGRIDGTDDEKAVGTKEAMKRQNSQNISPETRGQSPIIGSYPIDLVGLYYFGKPGEVNNYGSASVTYKLDSPSLLLTSQIDRVNVKVLADMNNGLCRYNTENAGAIFDNESMYDVCTKTLFGDTGDGSTGWYGYNPFYQQGSKLKGSDDEEFDSRGYASYLTLSSTNDWKGQLSSTEGQMTVSLIISDDDPTRVTGVQVDLADNGQGGYVYIAGLDVHMAGGICGESVYVGSSNPTADRSVMPAALTNAVNKFMDFFNVKPVDKAGNTVRFDAACNPWGPYSSTNPLTIVTSAATGSACEMAKGIIYNGVQEVKRLFWKAFGKGTPLDIGLFDDNKYAYNKALAAPSPSASWQSNGTTAAVPPAIEGVPTVNNLSTGAVYGRGSVRADLKFFAKANGNQMPIRNVTITWGDDSDAVDAGSSNFYKNHTQIATCVSDPSKTSDFGLMTDACENKPFAYSHVYGYSTSCSQPAPAGGYPEIGVKAGEPVCIFTPKVSVLDNWGATSAPASSIPIIVAP